MSKAIKYFKRTAKSPNSIKKMPETFRLIIENFPEGEYFTFNAIHFMYDALRLTKAKDSNFRDKKPQEFVEEIKWMITNGFIEYILINDAVETKIKNLQGIVKDAI